MSLKNDDAIQSVDASPRPWRFEGERIIDSAGQTLFRPTLAADAQLSDSTRRKNAELVIEAVNDLHAIESLPGSCPARAYDKARELRELWETMLGSRGAGGASLVVAAEPMGLDASFAQFNITDTDGSEFSVVVTRKKGTQVPDGDYKVPETWKELR